MERVLYESVDGQKQWGSNEYMNIKTQNSQKGAHKLSQCVSINEMKFELEAQETVKSKRPKQPQLSSSPPKKELTFFSKTRKNNESDAPVKRSVIWETILIAKDSGVSRQPSQIEMYCLHGFRLQPYLE
eukprot:scaffold59_cov144-Skeletonema_menzelii.AAC.6